MGGNGSMVQWVEAVPAKANKDYTHFNHRGAKEVANIIYSQINQGYETYKNLRKKRKPITPIKKEAVIIKNDSIHEE
jgi:hypothetical protein